jgi:uncharacterized protein YbaR (Trm112 family)/ubiquinone/menaquinone biosynthesis C-methylase UbiE
MRERLLEFLICPIDKTNLELLVWEEKDNKITEADLDRVRNLGGDRKQFEKEIISGVLINRDRKIYYPIYNGVPRMLTYDCKVFDIFREKFSTKIKQELKGYETPSLIAPVGEESVIRSFSKEWLEYNWDPNKYWKIKPGLMYKSMRFMLDIDNRPVKNKRMLEIGIGIGGMADYFSSKELSELVGIDLSYAVDAAYKNFGENKFLHIVQASAFRLPIKDNSFDYVYSQGVLHHSSDPKACFREVCKTTKEKGYFYVWLYNNVNENRNLLRRSIMVMEMMLRPLIWPMPYFLQSIILTPIALLYIIYEYYSKMSNKEMVSYSWREAFHSARDRFTPRYAFRYSEEEIAEWYKESGYISLSKISQRKIPDYLGHDFYLATAMIGQKG